MNRYPEAHVVLVAKQVWSILRVLLLPTPRKEPPGCASTGEVDVIALYRDPTLEDAWFGPYENPYHDVAKITEHHSSTVSRGERDPVVPDVHVIASIAPDTCVVEVFELYVLYCHVRVLAIQLEDAVIFSE